MIGNTSAFQCFDGANGYATNSSAAFASAYGRGGIANSLPDETHTFYQPLPSPAHAHAVTNSLKQLVVPIPLVNSPNALNFWHYDSSSTNRHNPGSYDLWAEYLAGKGQVWATPSSSPTETGKTHEPSAPPSTTQSQTPQRPLVRSVLDQSRRALRHPAAPDIFGGTAVSARRAIPALSAKTAARCASSIVRPFPPTASFARGKRSPGTPFHYSNFKIQNLRRAFTVLEMLVVITIIGFLAALALPHLPGMTKANAMTTALQQLLSDTALARQLALSHRTTVYMVFVPPIPPNRRASGQRRNQLHERAFASIWRLRPAQYAQRGRPARPEQSPILD